MDQNLAWDIITTLTPEDFVVEQIQSNVLNITNAMLPSMHDQLQACFTKDRLAGAARHLMQHEVELYSHIPEEHLRAILDFFKSEPGQRFILASREVAKKQPEWSQSIVQMLIDLMDENLTGRM